MNKKKVLKFGLGILLLFIVICVSFYFINKKEFTINVNLKGKKIYKNETNEHRYYIMKKGKRKGILITRKNNEMKSFIYKVKKNKSGVTAFYVGSYYTEGNSNIRRGWSFSKSKIKVEPYLIFVAPTGEIVSEKVYPKAKVIKMEWINNKKLKLETMKDFKNLHIKNPFNLTIYEKAIEEFKDFINWINPPSY